jgi:hypothetical protein
MKPILFNTEMSFMVRRFKKDLTRRMKGLEKINLNPDCYRYDGSLEEREKGVIVQHENYFFELAVNDKPLEKYISVKCPYGKPGDILWVKETFYAFGHWTTITDTNTGKSKSKFFRDHNRSIQFKAEWQPKEDAKKGQLGWHKRPALFLPKDCANNFLKIKNIRVERLWDIRIEDAVREGISKFGPNHWLIYDKTWDISKVALENGADPITNSPLTSFQSLWTSINGVESWNLNPWVWVIEFEKIKQSEIVLK